MVLSKMKLIVLMAIAFIQINCNAQHIVKDIKLEILDDRLLQILDENAQVDVLVEGLGWTEGPLWVDQEKMLLFSEIPSNTVYKWTAAKGLEVYLRPSGYTAAAEIWKNEPGSNGLLLDNYGNLVLCQHGNRRVAKMNAALNVPEPNFINIVDRYDNLRLNSPNDAVYHENGDLFFTDPPYGLGTQNDSDPQKELPFNGVFVWKKNKELVALTKKLSRPNGIAVLPQTNKIIVSNSDPRQAAWFVLDANEPDQNPTLFYDATNEKKGLPGLPDGLKVSKKGIIYASGPGGVWIFDQDAKLLGKINFNSSVSNVALSSDERFMFLTNTGRVVRIPLK